jgi:chitinase
MSGPLINESNSWLALCCISAVLAGCGGGGDGDEGNGGNGGNGGGSGGGTLPTLGIDSASITEGNSGTQMLAFDLTLTAAASGAVTVDYTSADSSAIAGEDYEAVSGTLNIPAGTTSAQLLATINGDDCFEEDETFSITLSNISANAQLVAGSATATISNDDLRRSLSVADAEIIEGDTGTSEMLFTVSLDSTSCFATAANYTSNIVTASDTDFVVETQSFTIPAGDTSVQIPVTINGDTIYESDETLTVNIEDTPAHIEVGDGEAFGTIRTDDLPPLTISGAEILEGDDVTTIMVFSVDLAGITNDISFDFATSDISATVADNDYTAASGTIVIPAGETHANIDVEVSGDLAPESHEDLRVTLSNLVGDAVLSPGIDFAIGTILDDDSPVVVDPTITVLQQGGGSENGSSPAVFGFYLNTVLTGRVQVDYFTSDITATAGVDYTARSGRVTIPAGSTSVLVEVPVIDDTEIEGNEYFSMELSLVSGSATLAQPRATGTVFDDDYVGPVILSANPRTAIFEGDSGTKEVSVIVTLSDAATDVVTVDYATVDATALAGSDYGTVSGTLTFDVGETLKSVAIPVYGDTVIEAHEYFVFALSNPGGTVLFSYDPMMPPVVLIESDDPFAQVSINNVGTQEGDAGTVDLVFTVSIDAPTEDPVSFDYLSSDGEPGYDHNALAGED